jgi:hypothetical protein
MGVADIAAAKAAAARAKAQEAAKKVIKSGGTADRAQQAATASRTPIPTTPIIRKTISTNKGGGNPLILEKKDPEPIITVESNTTSEPIFELPPPPPQMVRVPERDVVSLAQETISAETITNLLFENVGANELTKFVRHDTVEGINPYYDVISNLSDIKRKFDPSNLISLQKTTSSLFDIFPIKLQDKIPSDAYLLENNLTDFVYIDTNGDFVIEVVNLKDSEIVEIEIDTSGTIFEVDE